MVEQLFADTGNAQNYFSSELSADTVAQQMSGVPQDDAVTVNGVERSMTNSEVYVTAKTAEGGTVDYQVSLVRDGIGWKVTAIQLYFASQN